MGQAKTVQDWIVAIPGASGAGKTHAANFSNRSNGASLIPVVPSDQEKSCQKLW
jgi:hypothetical protein